MPLWDWHEAVWSHGHVLPWIVFQVIKHAYKRRFELQKSIGPKIGRVSWEKYHFFMVDKNTVKPVLIEIVKL